jgi:hypothetical protein
MQQQFGTRNYSVRDFAEWDEKNELVLSPKFQRRDVWSSKARSYLIDTIIRGKPIPKIYMRQDINTKTRRTIREIVDGQQRLRSVLEFLKDGFKISKTHNEDFGGKTFSQLDEEIQRDILKYEFTVDLLQDMPDSEVYDVFARLNTYSTTLNAQELRNAQFFGDFKTTVYTLAKEFVTFWEKNEVFSDKQMLRMAEAEFVSELLIAMVEGIRAKEKRIIDNFYNEYDDRFPNRKSLEKKFRETMDTIGEIMGDTFPKSSFRATRLLYPLFCAIYHVKFGLPRAEWERVSFKTVDYQKLRNALERVDEIFEKVRIAEEETEREELIADGQLKDEELEEYADAEKTEPIDPLTPEERQFYKAWDEHWVHADNRRLLAEYIYKLMTTALRG